MKNDDVQRKKSTNGIGLFANRDFTKDELIIEYIGEKITEEEANKRGGKYLFELNDEWTIDGKGRDNLARYINHACTPNCYPEIDEDEEKIFIYAKKKIKVGDELTYNYGKMYFDSFIGKDKCGCASCLKKREKAAAKDSSDSKEVKATKKTNTTKPKKAKATKKTEVAKPKKTKTTKKTKVAKDEEKES